MSSKKGKKRKAAEADTTRAIRPTKKAKAPAQEQKKEDEKKPWVLVILSDNPEAREPEENWFWIPADWKELIQEVEAFIQTTTEGDKDHRPATMAIDRDQAAWSVEELQQVSALGSPASWIFNLPNHCIVTKRVRTLACPKCASIAHDQAKLSLPRLEAKTPLAEEETAQGPDEDDDAWLTRTVIGGAGGWEIEASDEPRPVQVLCDALLTLCE